MVEPGVIIGAVKQGKKVIAVPRLASYGEHVDDHQVQLLREFDGIDLICACYDSEKLGIASGIPAAGTLPDTIPIPGGS